MNDDKRDQHAVSEADQPIHQGRRTFLRAAGAMATLGAGIDPSRASQSSEAGTSAPKVVGTPTVAPRIAPEGYNILFILTDQERYFDKWPFPVPGREALRRDGITFTNHQIASCVCSPSRSTIYTGQHIQHTGIYDNAGMPWQKDLSPEIRTVGDMLKDAGYYAAYLGKWHLGADMRKTKQPYDAPLSAYNHTMAEYGFDDYLGVGDLVGSARGGYNYDGVTTELAISWMRSHAPHLASEKKNWFLAVNLVNPHDIMYVNTDPRTVDEQNKNSPILGNARPPRDGLYQTRWDNVPLVASRRQPYNDLGRPAAQAMFKTSMDELIGAFPFTDDRLRTYQNYYFNCIRDCDTHIVRLLETLDSLQLSDRTVVILTSDHGDLGGAHQLIGKGGTAYTPQNHVPLIIRHPAYPGGKRCNALTSHIDIAPTLLGLTGLDSERIRRLAGDAAKGHNLAPLLGMPESVKINEVRQSALFNYAMLSFYDSEWILKEVNTLRSKGISKEEIHRLVLAQQPDLRLRGAIRSTFDGRYRFTRYFSLMNFNRPATLEELFANNDVELYDTFSDPGEMRNLAVDRIAHSELLLAMNQKLNDSITVEVGDDSPDLMPIRDGQVQFVNLAGHL
ncbi:choline-sulfatase [Paraburkholderia sp. BL6665CI2N2]|uniref:sulfatase-like hydrolase/transferase n=1 Tax=Paraburkholderia sp. BL6665CI2N2 TaxID=1938806 RepID=UPI001064BEB9|nr:sulfatase-like hydrolase/transferase [Paraburkholderia sp. BL6665CI2N2]TDY15497.1 choline-sulfatase [Paraburkholderia sp. BL6665CI2N2]